jgi:hypothetical protein
MKTPKDTDKFYKTMEVSASLNGHEMWVITETDEMGIQVSAMKFLRLDDAVRLLDKW